MRIAIVITALMLGGCFVPPPENQDGSSGESGTYPDATEPDSASQQSGAPRSLGSQPTLPDGWSGFVQPSQFSIYTPAPLYPSETNGMRMPNGLAAPYAWGGRAGGLKVNLSRFERDAAEVPALRQLVYQQGGSAGLKPLGEITSRKDVAWGGHAGVEFEVESAVESTVVRVLNVRNVFYSFSISAEKGMLSAADRAAFFDSFVLLE